MVIHGINEINKEYVFMAGDGYRLLQELMDNPIEILWLVGAFVLTPVIAILINRWVAKRRYRR